METKKWNTPELIILVKSQPEENVLSHCKYNRAPIGEGDPQNYEGHGCQAIRTGSCAACQDLGGTGS
ncbi:MAG: hypothetical protein JRJ14_11230 [Deltaproteobacteria bacterium]|nr:hypothetical protein [Deltaproteobacteria bacterium]